MKVTETMDDNFFQEIMSQSKLELPFPDFEDSVMIQIKKKAMQQSSFSKDLKLSWIFFIAGSVFGIVISLILPQMHKPIFGIQSDKLAIFFQIVFVSLLLTQIDILTKFIKRLNFKR
jgi:hypothetical protein